MQQRHCRPLTSAPSIRSRRSTARLTSAVARGSRWMSLELRPRSANALIAPTRPRVRRKDQRTRMSDAKRVSARRKLARVLRV
eukprot:965446-Rhodomonas_salina.3